MNTYYCVCESFYNSGLATAAIVDTVCADRKPEDAYKSTARCDVYIVWCESKREALDEIESVKRA